MGVLANPVNGTMPHNPGMPHTPGINYVNGMAYLDLGTGNILRIRIVYNFSLVQPLHLLFHDFRTTNANLTPYHILLTSFLVKNTFLDIDKTCFSARLSAKAEVPIYSTSGLAMASAIKSL